MQTRNRSSRLAGTVAVSLMLVACAQRPGGDASTSDASASEATTNDTEDSAEETTTGPPSNACDCAEDEVCVANCQSEIPGFPTDPEAPYNYRCIGDPACVPGEDLDTADCREAACDDPFAALLEHCGDPAKSPEGLDMICSPGAGNECSTELQDCPEGEKCVAAPFDGGVFVGLCVQITGMGAPGDPCEATVEPGFVDDCGVTSMCWVEGGFELDEYAGTCREFCGPGDPACPDPTECQPLGEGFELCSAPE